MFPTTVWTRIHEAGAHDDVAMEEFARRYRPAILEYIERRGFRQRGADDLCQEVFVRLLRGGVLAKADRGRGRFRGLLLAVTRHVIHDQLRKRRDVPVEDLDQPDQDPDFDQGWAMHLTARAMDRMRDEGSPYYEVLVEHLAGQPQDRTRLWHARRRLVSRIRHEVALTCATPADFEEEIAYLSRFLRPGQQKE
jgi:RNA polymerase sigma factor (sigma-70 family)